MLKRVMMKRRNKTYLSKYESNRGSIPFRKAKKIGIIVDNPSDWSNDKVQSVINNLEQEGKDIEVLCYSKKESESSKGLLKFFSFKDVKWNGRFKNFSVKKFMRTEFDYLFYLNSSPNLPIESVLARSMAKCRFAGYHNSREHCEVMVDTKHKNPHLLMQEMIHYAKMLN